MSTYFAIRNRLKLTAIYAAILRLVYVTVCTLFLREQDNMQTKHAGNYRVIVQYTR